MVVEVRHAAITAGTVFGRVADISAADIASQVVETVIEGLAVWALLGLLRFTVSVDYLVRRVGSGQDHCETHNCDL